MTETSSENLTPGAAQQSGLRTTTMICYGLYLLGIFTGFTTIIGVIIAYIKKSDAVGTVWESHFRNLILVFWVMFAAFVAMLVTFPITFYAVGIRFESDLTWQAVSALAVPLLAWILIYLCLFIWFLYRIIRGLMRAAEDRAY